MIFISCLLLSCNKAYNDLKIVFTLYSNMVLGGKFKTRFNVSLILVVADWSVAVLFQTDIISSENRTDTTAPQISSLTMNCSPTIARIKFSQHLAAKPFLSLTIHFPPLEFASSCKYKLMSGVSFKKILREYLVGGK